MLINLNLFAYSMKEAEVIILKIKGPGTPKSVKICKNVLLHINILEPFTNHGKVKKKIIISIILGMAKEEATRISLS